MGQKQRVRFTTWGKNAPGDGYAVADPEMGEGPVRAVVRSLERRAGLQCCGGPRSEGTALERVRAVANHYAVTLGSPCRGGGWTPRAEVWFAIPTEDMYAPF